MTALRIHRTGPGTTIQDQGRPGQIASGLSPGGAADRTALFEGAALLGQSPDLAALELPGMGGVFEALGDIRIALTGAPMPASVEGVALAWNASHLLHRGQTLTLGNTRQGTYAYLHLGGGIDTMPFMGSRSAHLVAHIDGPVAPGTDLSIGPDTGDAVNQALASQDRFAGGTIRIIPSVQTTQFDADALARLEITEFTRNPRGNRMGAAMEFDGVPFTPPGGLNILSEMVVPGDIQVTGDGTPFVLLYEAQTTGGYPRIGTVIPPDLPRVAHARAGDPIRFQFITRDAALKLHRAYLNDLKSLTPHPLIRDPADMRDLLSYQLISGMITGREKEET